MNHEFTFNKFLITILVFSFLFLNYKIWFSENSFNRYSRLKTQFTEQKSINEALENRNKDIQEEIFALADDSTLLEYAARSDLGMVDPGEIYYQFSRK
ncbi:MAG: septum formation initiator family protein [Pseudomonadota bacterium]|nr:septum formation initiator family protein [Pseudomonadota bacterium]